MQCSICDSTMSRTDITQGISLHIEEDASLSLKERLYDFFQPETLRGKRILVQHLSKILLGDKNTLLHTHPYNLNCPLEKSDPGEKNTATYPFRHYL